MRTIHFFRSAPHIALLLSLLLSACSDNSANEQNSTNNGSTQILINVSNTSVLEGDNGLSQLVFRVGLSKIASNDITVGYVTQNGLADSASDFVFIQDTLLIPAGSLTNTVRIDVNGDIQPEQHETMTLTLSNPTGAVLGNVVATGTIIDDDVRLLNVANVRAIEGDSGTSILSFEVSLDQIATTDVSVEYATKDGNATTQDNDFVTSTGILTIPAGGKTANIAVTINGDSNIEYDETFTLELSNISNNAVLSRGSVIATIVGDDIIIAKIDLPKTGQKNCFNSKGNIVSCAATGQDGDQQQGVNWPNPRFSQNVNNTITDNLTNLVWPQDWNTSAIQLVTWQAALDYIKSLNAASHLGFNDWRLPNRNELKSLLNYGVTENRKWLTESSQGFQNISAQAYWTSSTYKHEVGITDFAWVIMMSEDANVIGSANKSNTAGMAAVPVRGGSDYAIAPIAKTGQVLCYDTVGQLIACAGTGQDGELQLGYFWQTPRFTDNGNGSITDNTTMFVWSANTLGQGLTWQQALDEISTLNAQSYLGYSDWRMPNVNEIDSLLNSGLATVAWLEQFGFNNLQGIKVWTSTTDRCAKPTACRPTKARLFATSSTPWTALPKSTADNFNYLWPVRDNNTIKNSPELNVADVSVIEGNGGNTDLIFTVTLSAKSSTDVSVNYSISDVSATAGEDYLATNGSLSLFAGSMSNTITLSVVGDTVIESNEKLLLTLSNPTGATLGKPNAIAMIVDDETISPVNLPQTGQKNCFDSDANIIPCAGTGQDGELQPGVAWPTPRFVAFDNDSIEDKLTGLIWLANTNLMVTRDPGFDLDQMQNDGLVSWNAALNYVAKLNTELYLGANDWRLPNRNELNSLVDYARPNSASFLQDPSTGFNDILAKGYWTSTRDTFNIKYSWYVSFVTGFEGLGPYRAVLPVRSGQSNTPAAPAALAKTGQTQCYNAEFDINCNGTGQDGELQIGLAWPAQRFTNNNDGTVSDNLTGLMWTADGNIMTTRDPGYDLVGVDDGKVTWQQALDYVNKLNAESYLGYKDWRLPNAIEAQSRFLNQGLIRSWLTSNGFINVDFTYWTSSTHLETASHAWIFDKFERDKTAKTDSYRAWPVRGGL